MKIHNIGRLNIFILFLLSLIIIRCIFQPKLKEITRENPVITVEDMAGRLVDLGGPARRVMMLTPISWHYLTVEESDKYILMIPPYMRREYLNSPLNNIFTRISKLPLTFLDNKSIQPFSVEESMYNNPDVIFSWDYISTNYEKVNASGLIKISNDRGDKEKLYKILGGITNKTDRVNLLFEEYYRKRNYILDKINNNIEQTTFIVISNDTFSIWSSESFKRFNENANLLGGSNIGHLKMRNSGYLNFETILHLNPDIIYINPYTLAFTSINVRQIYSDERFQGLKAVQNRKIYRMPRGGSRLEGPVEEPLFMMWLYQTLHVDAPLIFDLRNEIKNTYKQIYNYEMSENEIDEWLRISENCISSNYMRLFRRKI
jgi:iron complex transport system substrate-binding protein